MFGQKSNEEDRLEEAINRVLYETTNVTVDSEEYLLLLTKLERLYALRPERAPRRVSPDALVNVAGNLLGILVIVAYEQKHVMISKALSLIPKMKSNV